MTLKTFALAIALLVVGASASVADETRPQDPLVAASVEATLGSLPASDPWKGYRDPYLTLGNTPLPLYFQSTEPTFRITSVFPEALRQLIMPALLLQGVSKKNKFTAKERNQVVSLAADFGVQLTFEEISSPIVQGGRHSSQTIK